MPERDELDRLIDSELARYAEPRVGLEQRILARVSGNSERSSRRRRLLLALAAPVTVSLLILAYAIQRTSNPQPTHVAVAPAATSAPRLANTPVSRQSQDLVSRVYQRSAKRLPDRAQLDVTERPKLDTFPTLQPLSASENVITRFAAEASEDQRKALLAPNQELTEPIRITAIHIPPLPSSEEDTN